MSTLEMSHRLSMKRYTDVLFTYLNVLFFTSCMCVTVIRITVGSCELAEVSLSCLPI